MEDLIKVEEPFRWRKAIIRKRTSDSPGRDAASDSDGEGDGKHPGRAESAGRVGQSAVSGGKIGATIET